MNTKPVVLSHHRLYKRNYSPNELLGEIANIVKSEDFEDFMFVAAKGVRRSVRIGSFDGDLRMGDLLMLTKFLEMDIVNDFE